MLLKALSIMIAGLGAGMVEGGTAWALPSPARDAPPPNIPLPLPRPTFLATPKSSPHAATDMKDLKETKAAAVKGAQTARRVPLPPHPPQAVRHAVHTCDPMTTREDSMVMAYEQLILGKGDTVVGMLKQHGVSINDANAIAQVLAGAMDARRVRPGDALMVLHGADRGGKQQMATLALRIPDGPRLTFWRTPDGRFVRGLPDREGKLHRRVLSLDRGLDRSLVGFPAPVVQEVKTAVVPVLPVRPSRQATLTIVYESPGEGESVLRFAALHDKGREHRLYRFPLSETKVAYLDEEGRGVALVDLRTPIDHVVEISSGWGWRIHPVLGNKRFHRGVDYRAPRGTRTLAATDGVVEDMGRRGNYGLYIRLRHSDVLSTAYAHLDGFAPHLKKGQRVKKGQPIGYVGMTGLATGPHLYYEVLVDNRQVNPMNKSDLVVPVRLTAQELTRFKSYVADTTQVIAH